MERTISLLTEKNHYLEKFYSLAEEMLPAFRVGNFEKLELFYSTREHILDILKYIDDQIHHENQDRNQNAQTSEEQKSMIRECLAIKDEYVSRIIEQDMEVLSCIEHAKNLIIKELQDVKRSKNAVGKYKSPTFENRLDEEA